SVTIGGDVAANYANGGNGSTFPAKADNNPVSLTDTIKADYPKATFGATIYISDDGKAWACAYQADTSTPPTSPAKSDFDAGSYTWKSAKKVGVDKTSGKIIGTSPKLPLKADAAASN
ncbi:MAG: hypothetical protein K2J80_12640, partial [Oscillospiraceae bacterium]|nr:hypothetical protein [Oscillospiraceae bacterium]